jgi:hypothetical protein
LKRRRIIKDWAIYGSVGYIYYEEVVQTRDIDIFVEVRAATEREDYGRVLREFGRYGPIVGDAAMFQVGPILIQVFPSTGYPLWEDAVANAVKARVEGEPVRVVSKEHLIILALARFDPVKDVPRIGQLYKSADKAILRDLLRRFDNDGELAKRLSRITEWLGRDN